MFLWAFPSGFSRKKKSFNFQAMVPSKMSAPIRPHMVEKCAQREREVVFRDEKLLIRPYSQFR